MKVRTYLAHSMDEAVQAVRRDLGSDAVILETRATRRGGFLGLFTRSVVELRATTADQVRPRRAPVPEAVPVVTTSSHARDAYLSSSLDSAKTPLGHEARREQTRSMARNLLNDLEAAPAPAPAATPAQPEGGEIREELDEIRGLVERVLQAQQHTSPDAAPPVAEEVFDLYLNLLAQECSEELAVDALNAVTSTLSREELEDQQLVRHALVEQLASFIPVADGSLLSTSPDGRPLTMALVGPTGVGKTTTVAKIAAAYRLRQGRTVGLITLDTYRIAAVEQLRVYAEIIGVPMQVARSQDELLDILQQMSHLDVVLIDTAGRSQKDSDRIQELRTWLDVAQPHEVHLVLASTASRSVLMSEADEFSQIGIDRVVLTKLDEAVNFGMLVEVTHRIGRKLSFLTTGQEVPDHIETARPARLAELVLNAGGVS
ncbi:MAG: flagellar biosynthesis protein FlhF [Phycisphaerales bacterium]|nr:flagellar biosynthesis protein FlhF [Phycisphaerales bacterium]